MSAILGFLLVAAFGAHFFVGGVLLLVRPAKVVALLDYLNRDQAGWDPDRAWRTRCEQGGCKVLGVGLALSGVYWLFISFRILVP